MHTGRQAHRATLDDTKPHAFEVCSSSRGLFTATIPDSRTVMKQGKNHGVIQSDTSVSRDDLQALRILFNRDDVLALFAWLQGYMNIYMSISPNQASSIILGQLSSQHQLTTGNDVPAI